MDLKVLLNNSTFIFRHFRDVALETVIIYGTLSACSESVSDRSVAGQSSSVSFTVHSHRLGLDLNLDLKIFLLDSSRLSYSDFFGAIFVSHLQNIFPRSFSVTFVRSLVTVTV